MELRNYEENSRIGSGNLKTAGRASQHHDEHGIIPVNINFKCNIYIDFKSIPHLYFILLFFLLYSRLQHN